MVSVFWRWDLGRMMWGVAGAIFIVWAYPAAAQAAVVVSEVMWDETEYVELYNTGSDSVDLTGWSLSRQPAGGAEKTAVAIADGTIAGSAYFLIEKKEEATTVAADLVASGLTLVNTGEQLTLRDGEGTIVDRVNQLGAWFAGSNTALGVSMERLDMTRAGTEADNWYTSTGSDGGRLGTPRAANSPPATNTPPVAVIEGPASATVGGLTTWSAGDSTDEDGDELTYAWDFGDGTTAAGVTATHLWSTAGTFTVVLVVGDGEAEGRATQVVVVTAPVYSADVVINEFLPNPFGSDTDSEFIELANLGAAAVEMAGWQLDDVADGGSRPYTFPAGRVIGAGAYLVVWRSESRLALNNTGDAVRLLNPQGGLVSEATYAETVAEGVSYNRTADGIYGLSSTPTPGAANVITAVAVASEDDDEPSVASASVKSSKHLARPGRVKGTAVAVMAISEVREVDEGTVVEVEGVVSVPPGVLGERVMYLAGSGIQVYQHQGQFPPLALGDRVRLVGTLREVRGESRLHVAAGQAIARHGSGEAPASEVVATGEVGEELEGSLVTVAGEVVQTSGATFYLDDGSGEVKVYIKLSTKIDKPKMKEGVAVTVTGVVSETASGYRILPRFQEDVRLGRVAGLQRFPATGAVGLFVAGAVALVLLLSGTWAGEPLFERRWSA